MSTKIAIFCKLDDKTVTCVYMLPVRLCNDGQMDGWMMTRQAHSKVQLSYGLPVQTPQWGLTALTRPNKAPHQLGSHLTMWAGGYYHYAYYFTYHKPYWVKLLSQRKSTKMRFIVTLFRYTVTLASISHDNTPQNSSQPAILCKNIETLRHKIRSFCLILWACWSLLLLLILVVWTCDWKHKVCCIL